MLPNPTVLAHLAGRFSTHPENLATEALAFILDRSVVTRTSLQGIAESYGCPCPENLVFQSQVSNEEGSRPDLAGKSPDGSVRLLIEAKFWAGLTEAQPLAYLRNLNARGLLLFIAPEQRLITLWSELSRRLSTAEPSLEVQPVGPGCVRVGTHIMALISWRDLLGRLVVQVEAASDLATAADLKQLSGLCDQMDSAAFLPLTSEEMTGNLGRRVVQFCELMSDLVGQLVDLGYGNLKGLSARGTFGAYSRYIALNGYGAVIQFSAVNWSIWGKSPVWRDQRRELGAVL